MGSRNMKKPSGDKKLSYRKAVSLTPPRPQRFPTLAGGVVILRAVAFYTVPVGICEVACVPAAGVPFKVTGDLLVTLSGHHGVAVSQGHIIHPSPLLARAIQVHQTDELQL